MPGFFKASGSGLPKRGTVSPALLRLRQFYAIELHSSGGTAPNTCGEAGEGLRRHVEQLGESCRGDRGVNAASLEHSDSRLSKISAKPANASSTTVEAGAGCSHSNTSMAPIAKMTVAQWRSMTFPRRYTEKPGPLG